MKRDQEYDQLEIRIHELEKVMKKSRRLYERYQAIMLHLKGYTNIKIAEIIGRSNLTIGTYIKRYQAAGIAGLEISYSPGAPRRLTPEQEDRIYEIVVHNTPAELGLKSEMNWTAPLLREWIYREWNIIYKDRAVLNILHRLGFSHTRPTYTLEKANAQKQQTFREMFETYKKLENGEIDTILFQDESTIRDYVAVGYSWFCKGKQRKIPTYGKHQSVKLLGVLDYEKGDILCIEEERFDAKVFLSFLQQVLVQYPEGKIVMILDNARIHHAKLIQPFLQKYTSRLELVFLPPYSPNLNPIEGLWKWLKSSIIYNVFYTSVAEIRKAVQEFIQKVNLQPQQVID